MSEAEPTKEQQEIAALIAERDACGSLLLEREGQIRRLSIALGFAIGSMAALDAEVPSWVSAALEIPSEES